MSYASDVKKELTMLEVHPEHAKAELAALIRLNGEVLKTNGKKTCDCSDGECSNSQKNLFAD